MRFLSISCIIFFVACGQPVIPPPENLIPDEKMVNILVSMHKADAEKQVNRLHYPDSSRMDTVDYGKIFMSFDVTRADYDSSMRYYAREPAILDGIYDQVMEKLNKERLETETAK